MTLTKPIKTASYQGRHMNIHIFMFWATNFFRNEHEKQLFSKEISRVEHEYIIDILQLKP